MKIYYIETTMNGYVFRRTPICEYEKGKDFSDDLIFEHDGEGFNYYEDIAGDMDELDAFLKNASNYYCKNYHEDNHLRTKKNVFLEYWYTDVLGYYSDRYIGLEIA